MQIDSFKCKNCGLEFDFIVDGSKSPHCPSCGNDKLIKNQTKNLNPPKNVIKFCLNCDE